MKHLCQFSKRNKIYLTLAAFLISLIGQAQWQEMSFESTDSVLITYYTKGTGIPILIIPGGPGYNASYLLSLADSMDKVFQSGFYENPVQATFIIPDLRGTGKSKIATDEIDRKVNFSNVIADLEQLRKNMGYENWTVCGHSFGGILAEYYACQFPEAIDKMVLLSTPDPVSWDWASNISLNARMKLTPSEIALRDTLESMMKYGNNLDSLKLIYDQVMLPVYIFDRKDTLRVKSILKDLSINMAVFNKMSKELSVNRKYMVSTLPSVKMPVLILHGIMDPLGEGVAYKNQKLIPHAELNFRAGGHFLWVESSTYMEYSICPFIIPWD